MILSPTKKAWFITGTDTNIGKTWATVALLKHLKNQGIQVQAMKPISSGCQLYAEGLRNQDALSLQQYSSKIRPYEQINPYAFAAPIAPHIAAQQQQQQIKIELIVQQAQLLADNSQQLIIEGVGGWCVPISAQQQLTDLVLALNAEVILVIGLKLGCINHALLTASHIQQQNITLKGWIANHLQPEAMAAETEILKTLDQQLNSPCLGIVPWANNLAQVTLQTN